LILGKFPLSLKEVIGHIAKKEIRHPISKLNIIKNWGVIGTQKEAEMEQIYYSRKIEDDEIEKMIDELPLDIISTR
jgi:hypothetical protein